MGLRIRIGGKLSPDWDTFAERFIQHMEDGILIYPWRPGFNPYSFAYSNMMCELALKIKQRKKHGI